MEQTMPDSMTAGPQDKSRITFFDLPSEIRNMIYQLALVDKDNLALCMKYGQGHSHGYKFQRGLLLGKGVVNDSPESRLSPNPLATNRLIKSEAKAIFYGQPLHINIFDYPLLLDFMGPSNWSLLLRDISLYEFSYHFPLPHHRLSLIPFEKAENLERLRYEMVIWDRGIAFKYINKIVGRSSKRGTVTGMQEGVVETGQARGRVYHSKTWTSSTGKH
ncbi:hypothetical protein BDV97DRAFT_201420 [Delphinella strobiligena]|nr:hypothetical protein BDV97DRAFT_201420 [Delphinella strobiligena]